MRTVLVTGGAGFIGSAVVRLLVGSGTRVVNLDKLTYAGNLASLSSVEQAPNYRFVHGDIADRELVGVLLREENVDGVMHLAAESHVDRSIDGPEIFVTTNVLGTVRLLATVTDYWQVLPADRRAHFRFHHISTDEVFGDLPFDSGVFTETTPYAPSSPYSASKAASDHFVGDPLAVDDRGRARTDRRFFAGRFRGGRGAGDGEEEEGGEQRAHRVQSSHAYISAADSQSCSMLRMISAQSNVALPRGKRDSSAK